MDALCALVIGKEYNIVWSTTLFHDSAFLKWCIYWINWIYHRNCYENKFDWCTSKKIWNFMFLMYHIQLNKYSKFSRDVKQNSSNMKLSCPFFLSNLISMALGLWILTKIKYHAQLLFMELMIKFLCIVSAYVIIVPMVTWYWDCQLILHYCDVIMTGMSSQTTSLKIVYSTIYSGADQRKHQSFVSLTFLWGIHQWLVNSPHKGLVMQKCFHLMTSSWL